MFINVGSLSNFFSSGTMSTWLQERFSHETERNDYIVDINLKWYRNKWSRPHTLVALVPRMQM